MRAFLLGVSVLFALVGIIIFTLVMIMGALDLPAPLAYALGVFGGIGFFQIVHYLYHDKFFNPTVRGLVLSTVEQEAQQKASG